MLSDRGLPPFVFLSERGEAMEKKLTGVKGCAAYLRVSVDGVYAMVHERKIPFYKVGRQVRSDLAEINAWLEQRKHQPLQ